MKKKYLITRIEVIQNGNIKAVDTELETDNIESTRTKLLKETEAERINFNYEERNA